ncbi:aminotransferase class V-fold PLP-dependent enzyme [Lentisphaera profundi]|uniref:Aminotransferase class V-fold PLP-dependent enzyme n=1 Tax=Lentisphaera profundi TaxID=1658616 RepID=A0ABY7VU85_9BACT|nr:aminotransferase class V-fold PLP-dependent enzyme [Lentisphaera profundi]WDE96869.1 aminotransferase class V-fold PLP-dependent enzyme [Lentisphaera profundi]
MIYEDYAIFTPGPVKMSDEILQVGAQQTPYFRNQQFSDITFSCEKDLLEMVNAPEGSKVIFLTASGTAGLEATVMNLLNQEDNALVVNGGGFGARFVNICATHGIPHSNFKVKNTDLSDIETLAPKGNFNSLIVNAHETSVGHLYDLDAMGDYALKNDMLYIVDAISMLVTDPLDMQKSNIDLVIASSQKGLALPPGLTMVILAPKALEKLHDINSLYFNFKDYLKNGERGQTPYTPAVTIMLQLKARLDQINRRGGIEQSIAKAKEVARYFRNSIKALPLKEYTAYMPNAMTTLSPTDGKSAMDIVNALESDYKVMVCPNGGAERDIVFRVSHMGEMTKHYTDILINALHDYYGVARN